MNPYSEIYYILKAFYKDINGCYIDKKQDMNVISDRWREKLEENDRFYNPNLTKKTSYWSVGE